MKITRIAYVSALLCAVLGANLVYSQDAPPGPNAAATNAPAGARRGGGSPLSEADLAEIARVADFPAWTPGAGDGIIPPARCLPRPPN